MPRIFRGVKLPAHRLEAHPSHNKPMKWVVVFLLGMTLVSGCKPKSPGTAAEESNASGVADMKMPKDPADAEIFRQLKKANHDFSQPTQVIYYLYFTDETAARGVIHVLSSDGYAGDLAMVDGKYQVKLTKTMKLDADTMDLERFKMRDLTVNNGGEYDGWEAAVILR